MAFLQRVISLPFPILTSLEGKVLIVTGASDGIGAQLAVALRKRGAKLVLNARNEARMRAAGAPGDLVLAGDLMLEDDSKGVLVNVASIAAQISLPWLPVYSASKFALASLSSTQRMELRKHGVGVMTVFPGYVDTDFQAHSTGSEPPPAVAKGKRFAVTAAQCAEAIVRGIERRRSVVVTPRIGWAAVWLNRLFPRFMESCISS
jgi:short-subunit dehydrogenase